MSTVLGWDELRRKLRQLETAVAAKAVLAAVEAGALVIENQSKENCPVVTGSLRRSLHHETVESNADTAVVDIGTDLVYARRVHDGFVGADSLGRHYNQAGNPYLLSAYEEKKNEAMSETSAALRQLVDKASR